MDNIDLITGDYTIIRWPDGKIHSNKFPYLLIRVAFGVYSIKTVLKEIIDNDINGFLGACREAGAASGYRACLVISESKCFYIEPDGKTVENNNPPSGGTIVNWQKFVDGVIKRVGLDNDKAIFYAENGLGTASVVFPGI